MFLRHAFSEPAQAAAPVAAAGMLMPMTKTIITHHPAGREPTP
jgi:hypothetical protein